MNIDLNKFWEKVDKTGPCWVWTASTKDGYGRFNSSGYAHRISWELHFGKIPVGLFVCHKCDNPPCVNPDHLFVGTNQDNVNDMISKKRNSKPPPMGGWNKKEYPQEIISKLGTVPDTELANIVGVTRSAIRRERKRHGIQCFPNQTKFKKGAPHPRWSRKEVII